MPGTSPPPPLQENPGGDQRAQAKPDQGEGLPGYQRSQDDHYGQGKGTGQ